MRSIYLARRQIRGRENKIKQSQKIIIMSIKQVEVLNSVLLILSNDVISLTIMYDYINSLYFKLSKGIAIYQIICIFVNKSQIR